MMQFFTACVGIGGIGLLLWMHFQMKLNEIVKVRLDRHENLINREHEAELVGGPSDGTRVKVSCLGDRLECPVLDQDALALDNPLSFASAFATPRFKKAIYRRVHRYVYEDDGP
jgi:hypothetical protein